MQEQLNRPTFIKSAPGSYWTADGVHPNIAGINLMAHAWLEAVK